MIKLNNKKITYVALADSNNSIKAPKEIWYADSNNSVKLVYRRKDALIEGEDYEKYHWLVGDADAYINTLKYYRPYDDSVQLTFRDNLYPNRESKYNKHNVEEQIWGACRNNNYTIIRSYISGNRRIANNIINATTTEGDVNWASYSVQSDINESSEHSLYVSSVNDEDKYYFIYNGSTKDNLPTRYTLPELVQQDVRIFRSGLLNNDYFNGSFFNFIHYRNNVEITHLIPCKLLKPVPKWLDANGIRRQIGECGMIDLVSGKFYGNVNSVGTFTVENYYERKVWLQGRNGAYIDTNYYPIVGTDVFSVHFHYDGTTRNPDGIEQVVFGVSLDSNKAVRAYINGYNNLSCNYSILKNPPSTNIHNTEWVVDNLMINGEYYQFVANDINYSFSNNNIPYTVSSHPLYVFKGSNQVYNNNCYLHGDISTFKITDTSSNTKMDLIPCTLTMDLPASMDANNIARTKGTSGMWDLVSDKFYGNVANSGTFKAVNLAEGVDYEVHQWLKGDGTAYIDTNIIVNSSTLVLSIKSKASSSKGALCGSRNGVNLNPDTTAIHYQSGRYRLDLLSVSNDYVWVDKDNLEDTFNIDLASNTAVVNGTSFTSSKTHTNSINTFRVFGCFGANVGYSGYINKFMLNDSYNNLNLVPIKLLKSIPSKYDANGIARQAGECGMYDTVNDVFYGNIASSGTFSVEDDS